VSIEPQSIAASDAFYEYPELSPEAPQLPDETDAPAGTDGGVPDPGEAADGSADPAHAQAQRPLGDPDHRHSRAGLPGRSDAELSRTHKRSVRSVLIVTDDATIIRHSQLRGLLELAGNMKTLGEALGVDPEVDDQPRACRQRHRGALPRRADPAVRLLIGTEEGT
jgi:hypothetical protein